MSIRVVVYAEGGNETANDLGLPPAPGCVLVEHQLGPAHVFLRRVLVETRGVPEGAVVFEAPLRDSRGRIARGTALYDSIALRRLLTWANPELRPHIAIVLIDADGDRSRRQRLADALRGVLVDYALAIAVQEFEAWLIADQAALNAALGAPRPTTRDLETLAPREAKELLEDAARAQRRDLRALRTSLAASASLDELARRCPSFDQLRTDLQNLRRP